MPLKKGGSKEVVAENIRELHRGKTFARTRRKHGVKKARAQSLAIAMSQLSMGRK